MADYEMTLTLGDKTIIFPVLPAKFSVKSPGKNETTTVLELGEINIVRQRGLREIAFESFFPKHMGPYVTGRTVTDPIAYIKDMEEARAAEQHGLFRITGTDLNVNMEVAIESLEYEERGGEVGDIYYKLTLKEWKEYAAVTVAVRAYGGRPVKRSGSPAAAEQKTHTVVKGDCLWAIAQKYYGDGSKYPELYAKNKTLIDNRNAGYNVPKYTIYPGQVLVL